MCFLYLESAAVNSQYEVQRAVTASEANLHKPEASKLTKQKASRKAEVEMEVANGQVDHLN